MASRQVTTTVVDPKEKLKAEAGDAYVPFWPAGRPQPTGAATDNTNDFSTVRSPTRFRWPALMVMAQGRSLSRFRLRGVAA